MDWIEFRLPRGQPTRRYEPALRRLRRNVDLGEVLALIGGNVCRVTLCRIQKKTRGEDLSKEAFHGSLSYM